MARDNEDMEHPHPEPSCAMPRYRIRIVNVPDRTDQLRRATRVWQDLIEHDQVWLDPDHPLQGVHCDTEGHSYFEFAAESREAISGVLVRDGYSAYTELTETEDPLGQPCQDCGNVAGPILPPQCPNCGFVDIGRCPICNEWNSRRRYDHISGSLYYCPTRSEDGARHRVRLVYNEPLINLDGSFKQPLILVKEAARR
jgi:hypothetical protein